MSSRYTVKFVSSHMEYGSSLAYDCCVYNCILLLLTHEALDGCCSNRSRESLFVQ